VLHAISTAIFDRQYGGRIAEQKLRIRNSELATRGMGSRLENTCPRWDVIRQVDLGNFGFQISDFEFFRRGEGDSGWGGLPTKSRAASLRIKN
jgi:hypothetical protein